MLPQTIGHLTRHGSGNSNNSNNSHTRHGRDHSRDHNRDHNNDDDDERENKKANHSWFFKSKGGWETQSGGFDGDASTAQESNQDTSGTSGTSDSSSDVFFGNVYGNATPLWFHSCPGVVSD